MTSDQVTDLNAGKYEVYQTFENETSRGAYANMGTSRYTGLSVADGRRMVYINGDTNTASNSINIPKLNTLGLGYTIGADTSASRTIVLGNVNNLAADSRAIVSAVKHLTIWEEAGDIKESDIDPATSTVLEVTLPSMPIRARSVSA